MLTFLSWVIYIPLQILFIPFAILGGLLVAYKQIVVSKKLGLSQTAVEVINGRWTMHIFGMRNDEATARLAAVLPNTSLAGLWLTLLPLWVKYKISGTPAIYPRVPKPGAETMVDLMIARTIYLDDMIRRYAGQVEQFVVMGAGYDVRAHGELQQENLTFFELDQPVVQQHKQACLQAAGISGDHVRFASIDFEKESAFEKLREAGFDASRKTIFLWEGVTLYLSETDVRKTLGEIRGNAAAGSVLLADFYAHRFLQLANISAQKKVLDQTGENLVFGFDFAVDYENTFAEFVKSESMSVGETFFMGREHDKGPFVVIAELKID